MPFTVADVDKHKADLSPSMKELWVEVANDSLERCTGELAQCEGSAIRQATAVVNRAMGESDTLGEKILNAFVEGQIEAHPDRASEIRERMTALTAVIEAPQPEQATFEEQASFVALGETNEVLE